MAVIVDSYSESNVNSMFGIQTAGRTAGQTFQSSAGVLASAVFYLSKTGNPIGNIRAELYATSGTFGVDENKTGSVLATSDNIDVSTLGTDALITFTFSGANKYSLVNGVAYVILVAADFSVNATDYYSFGIDTSSPSHNGVHILDATRFTTRDSGFYVYKDDAGSPSASLSPSGSQSPSASESKSESKSQSPSASESA